MIEKWLKTVRTKAAGPGAAAARMWARSPGLWTAGAAILGVGLLWVRAHPPGAGHRREIAAAYGAANTFYGAPQLNHAGSQFTYVATTDARGCALYLCDPHTQLTRQIAFQEDGLGAWRDDYEMRAGPWAPDDRCFVCCVSNRLMVGSADPSQDPAVIDPKPFSEAVWLTSAEFAYVSEGTNLCLAQKGEAGAWEHKLFLSRKDPLVSLTTAGSNAVAWLEHGEVIWRADLSAGPATETVAAATNQVAPPTAGLRLWLDASRLRQPDRAVVMGLPDLSDRRNDAVLNGTPPVFNGTNSLGALAGQGTVHFAWLGSATNGTGLKTRASLGITGAAPRSMFVVMRHTADRPMMVSLGDTSAHGALFAVEWSERLFLPTGWWADNYIDLASTNWNVLEVVYDGVSQKGYVNGVRRGVASATLNTVERGVEIGFRDATGGNDAKAAEGDFAELLIYDRALDAVEREQVEDYLGAKWFGQKTVAPQSLAAGSDPGIEGMTGLVYAPATGELLISRTDNGRDSVWRLDPAAGPNAGATQVAEGAALRGAQWAGPGRFAYVTGGAGRSQIVVADGRGAELSRRATGGTIRSLSVAPAGDRMLFVGSVSNEPADGIWQCNLKTGALQNLVACSGRPCPDAMAVPVVRGYVRPNWPQLTCVLYAPPKVERGRQYPLVISDTVVVDAIHGPMFQSAMAGTGAYVAITERIYWPTGIEQWATNVINLYENLIRDPTVDRRRVYLFAASAETKYMSELVEKTPGPWRGVILLNPTQLPDFSKAPRDQPRPKILIVAGGQEAEEPRFQKYQRDALPAGVLVEYVIGAGETHRYVGKTAKRERAEAVERFIFEE